MEKDTSPFPQRVLAIITKISHKILDQALSPKTQDDIHDFAVQNPKMATFIGLQILLCAIPFLLFLAFLLSLAFISLSVLLIVGGFVVTSFTVISVGAAFFLFLPLLFASSFTATALSLFLLCAYIIWQWIEKRYRPRLTMRDLMVDVPAFAASILSDNTQPGVEKEEPKANGDSKESRPAGDNEESSAEDDYEQPGLEEDEEQPGEDDEQPGEDDEQPGKDDEQPGEDDEQPGEDDEQPGEDDEQPGEDDEQPGPEDDDEQPGPEDDDAPQPGPSPLPSPPPSPPPNPLPHPVMGGI